MLKTFSEYFNSRLAVLFHSSSVHLVSNEFVIILDHLWVRYIVLFLLSDFFKIFLIFSFLQFEYNMPTYILGLV